MNAITQGLELHKQGKDREALPFFKQAIQEDPQSDIAWTYLGLTLLRLKDHPESEAFDAFEQALSINPLNPIALGGKGGALTYMEHNEEGLALCQQALSLSPDCPQALYYKGIALLTAGRYEAALEVCDQLLVANSTYTIDTLVNKSQIFLNLGRTQESVLAAERATRMDPNSSRAWRAYGYALAMSQQYAEAMRSTERALAIDTGDDSAWLLKGLILADLQQYKEAVSAFDHALAINPHNQDAQEARADVQKTRGQIVAGHAQKVGCAILAGLFAAFVEFIKAIFTPVS